MNGTSNKVRHFEDLWVWQEARRLVGHVYADFGDATTAARDFTFRDQTQITMPHGAVQTTPGISTVQAAVPDTYGR